MRLGILRALALSGLLLLLSGATRPSSACATEGGVYIARVDYEAGAVTLAARCDPGTARVMLTDGLGAEEVVNCYASAEALFAPIQLATTTTVTVTAFGISDTVMWSQSIALDPGEFRPRAPMLSVVRNEVVAPRWAFSGEAGVPVTRVETYVRETLRSSVATLPPGADGWFTVPPVAVPFGRATVEVRPGNGFGWATDSTVARVYNLGADTPRTSRYVFIYRSRFWMFYVSGGRVVRAWPIAVGMKGAPTPAGTFKIGPSLPSSGAWGPLRRPLRRVASSGQRFSGYYIHGHAPGACWSIGMPSSQGCIRMHNSAVREFARLVPNGTTVRVR